MELTLTKKELFEAVQSGRLPGEAAPPPSPARVLLVAAILRKRGTLNLARDTGLSPGGVSRILSRENFPSLHTANTLARSLNCAMEELYFALLGFPRKGGRAKSAKKAR